MISFATQIALSQCDRGSPSRIDIGPESSGSPRTCANQRHLLKSVSGLPFRLALDQAVTWAFTS
jgi:hypothetical protein